MRIIILTLLLTCFNSIFLKSQDKFSTNNSWEVWQNSIPVSAGIKVGIMDAEIINKINPKTVYVNLPLKPTSDLCIEVSSKDGRYKAQRLIKKDELNQGVNSIPWPTEYPKKLSDFSSSEITILSRLTESCEDDPDYMVASSWSSNFNSETVNLYLRSSKPPSIVFSDNNKIIETVKCKSIDEEPKVSYDCVCAIPRRLLSNDYSILILKKTKKRGRTKTKKYPIRIKL